MGFPRAKLCRTAAARLASLLAPPPTPHQSHRNLDGLRLIAAVGIVLFHYNIYLSQALPYTRPFTQQFPYFVDLFFVISGIVIAMVYGGRLDSGRTYAAFISARLARLYPLHLATLLFYAAIGLAVVAGMLEVVNPERYDFRDFLPNLLLVHAWGFGAGFSFNYVSWSVSAELFCYLAFPLLLRAVSGSALRGAAAVAVVALAAELATTLILERFPAPPEYNVSFVRRAVIGFTLGLYVYLHRALWARWIGVAAIRAGGNLGFAAMMLALMAGAPPPLSLGLVYLTVFLHFVADEKGVALLPAWKGFSGLAELTYATYMLHTVAATLVVSFVFPRLFGTSDAAVVASLLAALAFTYAMSVLAYRFLENPARKAWRRATDRWLLTPRSSPSKATAKSATKNPPIRRVEEEWRAREDSNP